MKTQDQLDYENSVEAQKQAVAEKYEREALRGTHRPGKVRNPMTHLQPKKKKRKK